MSRSSPRQQFIISFVALLLSGAATAANAAGGPVTDYDQQLLDELIVNQSTLTPTDVQTALWRAASQNLPKTVAWSLQLGADVDGKNEAGMTAIMVNVMSARHDDATIERLEKSFKDFSPWPGEEDRVERERATLNELLRATHDIDARDNHGGTALLYAAAYKRFDIVLTLHAAGADLNYKNPDGVTAVSFAPPGLLMQLVKLGTDINAADVNGNTVLHRAMGRLCDARLRDYVEKAVKAGARDSKNAKGEWASELPDPGFCPTLDFGPNGLNKQLALVEQVRAKLKATHPTQATH